MGNIKYLILFLILLSSCNEIAKKTNEVQNNTINTNQLTDKNDVFLWRENRYDSISKDTFNSIVISSSLCKKLSDPEIAALGYVGTYIGSDCNWDGDYQEDRSNLKCKILSSLNLGYQCSEKHLGFLKKWFKNDKKVINQINENCPTTPFTATSQQTFDKISIKVNGNKIAVSFDASGINMRERYCWSWTETDYFLVKNNSIQLMNKVESNVKNETF
jgi:hypothetical protein